MTPYTDIVATGWVARLPPGWRAYALLGRFDRPIGAWLLFLPGLWTILLARAPVAESARLILLFLIGAFLMRGAGCVINDMWDRDMDRRVTRTAGRPLAAGTLRMRHAAAFLAILMSISLSILVQLTPLAEALGVISLALIAIYPLAKRVTWWPQAMLGITFGWGAPMGIASATGHLQWAGLAAYAAAFMWILGYDTIYAHQDREDDALVGVHSTARLFARNTGPLLRVCYAATLLFLALAGWFAGLSVAYFISLAVPAWLLWSQIRRLDVDDPGLCLRLFKLNREVGFAVAGAILLGRLI